MTTPASDNQGREIRVGIVGTGGIAAVHAGNIAKLDGRERIVAATDIDAARVAAFAAEWSVEHTSASLEEMLDQVDLDVVHLCSPPGLHKEQAILALGRGVHVLSEKPPALSLDDLDEIIAAERASGASFGTISQHRFGGRAMWLRKAIADELFGRPLTAVCNTLWYRPDPYFDVPWRGNWEAEGGGPTMGHGIHQIDTMLSLLGPWSEVVAVAARSARATETEDLSHAIVTLESGAIVSVVNSFLSARQTSYLRFDFEYGTVELEHLYGYSDDSWVFTPAPEFEHLQELWDAGATGNGSGHSAQFAAVVEAIRDGKSIPVESASARVTLELIAGVYESAFTGSRVKRGEILPGSPFAASMLGTGAPWHAAEPAAASAAVPAGS